MAEPTETALAPRDEILQPLTGELIARGDLPKIAEALDQLREHRQRIKDAVDVFTAAVIGESRRAGSKTLVAAGLRLEVSADNEIEWDVEELQKLRAAGLPEERYAELVTEIVSYKVDGSVARQIEGASEEYAVIVKAARKRIPKRQYVSVKPA